MQELLRTSQAEVRSLQMQVYQLSSAGGSAGGHSDAFNALLQRFGTDGAQLSLPPSDALHTHLGGLANEWRDALREVVEDNKRSATQDGDEGA
jgi:hypothetical protein